MKKEKKLLQFGEEVEGYDAPVLNEREIRAAAGILFLVMAVSLSFVLFKGNFLLIKYVIIGFFTDFLIRVIINPKFSPTLIMGRMIVSRQVPEYVGAPQKKFAWTIGLALSGLMFFLLVIVNSYSVITGSICLVCLVFLFFETAFGICLGCLFYPFFYKTQMRYCTGDSCDQAKEKPVQNTTWAQRLIVLGFVVSIGLAAFFFNDRFREAPRKLWTILQSEEHRH
ncbi:DUF4395 domain-containing protein [Flavisolibacter nicotianae]|uniref:DUF4395 domain-containing protein n=1 Tax=Flavisolibacter nicotianae TaxID=2364882 RepID=UPI000EB567CE|nr:DUF4395 domain-containing protein [Flavisolibacter nicotianae]